MEKLFKLKENNTTVRTEIIAGVTTFFASVFTIIVMPNMVAGGNAELAQAVFFATAIGSVIGTLCMAFIANLPFVVAPAMGLGAFFAITAMPMMAMITGISEYDRIAQYQMALTLVIIAGALFMISTFGGIREKVINGFPPNIKAALGTGIGMFIASLGLRQAGIVVGHPTNLVQMIDFGTWATNSHNIMGAIFSLLGFFLMAGLYFKKVKGAFLIGILFVTALAYIFGYSTVPEGFSFDLGSQARNFVEISFFRADFGIFTAENIGTTIGPLFALILAFTLVNLLDSLGVIFGVCKSADMVNEKGEVTGLSKGLLSDAIGTLVGGILGSPTNTTGATSSTGIAAGGRTGLTALTSAILYISVLVLAPFVALLPGIATAPALMFIGVFMMSQVKSVDFSDLTEAVPAFLTIIMMPLTSSVANGIALGLASYVLMKLITGRVKEITPVSAIIAGLFALQYIL